LQVGEEVFAQHGWLRLQSVRNLPDDATTYNFMVADDHNYFVGELGLWVHNCCRLFETGLRGKSLSWINKQKPRNWTRVTSNNRTGFKWLDGNGVERFRFQRPNGKNSVNSKWSRGANGYMRWKNEKDEFLDVDGNVVPKDDPDYDILTHIPYEGL
jgi:hypothetical protein